MSSLLNKHKFSGIGDASAAMVLASLAANPATVFLTTGVPGKLLFALLSRIFSSLASMGLILLNVGAERLLTAVDKIGYDDSWDTADKLIEEIRKTGRDLTPEEIKSIDEDVIKQFRKFAKLGKK